MENGLERMDELTKYFFLDGRHIDQVNVIDDFGARFEQVSMAIYGDIMSALHKPLG